MFEIIEKSFGKNKMDKVNAVEIGRNQRKRLELTIPLPKHTLILYHNILRKSIFVANHNKIKQ